MVVENRFEWISHLKDVQNSYNNTPQRKKLHNFTPNEIISDPSKEKKLRRLRALDLLAYYKRHDKPAKFKLHDRVRYLLDKDTPFAKGYTPQFSEDIREIRQVKDTVPVTYLITNSNRTWYQEELSLTKESKDTHQKQTYIVEKTRKVGGRTSRSNKVTNQDTEYLVKNINDKSFSKWLNEAEYQKLKQNGFLLNTAE